MIETGNLILAKWRDAQEVSRASDLEKCGKFATATGLRYAARFTLGQTPQTMGRFSASRRRGSTGYGGSSLGRARPWSSRTYRSQPKRRRNDDLHHLLSMLREVP